jgi:hypothetical protein
MKKILSQLTDIAKFKSKKCGRLARGKQREKSKEQGGKSPLNPEFADFPQKRLNVLIVPAADFAGPGNSGVDVANIGKAR